MSDLDPRQLFVDILGPDAPVVPTTAEGFNALPLAAQMALRANAPAWTQALIGNPASLPPAVSLRRDAGELTHADLPALRQAGLLAEALQLEQIASDVALQSFSQTLEQERDTRQAHAQADVNANAQARLASMAVFGGVKL